MNRLLAYRRFMESRGVLLESIGLAERALLRADALHAVALVESEGGSVLGGDVYIATPGQIESAYANWYFEQCEGEPDASFAVRSCSESRSYIARYPDPPRGEPMFVLVIGDNGET